ncbi:MAG: NAD(P)/FAD-dependent oxidoreductase [Eggerthellaceae bacterium]|nr:NAD(P)/FAD-dependent oxidoreductase [Eggerthellaceae bacterium]
MAGGTYDFIVLGGGHNGLVSSIYLARAGFKVALLEANDEFGGGTRSAEFHPGYTADLGAIVHFNIAKSPVFAKDELDLFSKYGMEYCRMDSVFCSIFEDDSYLTVSQDIDKFCNDIAKYSEKDAEAYKKFYKYIGEMAGVVAMGTGGGVPPYGVMINALSKSAAGMEFLRVLNSSAQQIVEEWFESEQLRVTLTRWATEMMIDPRMPGTSTILLLSTAIHNPAFPGALFPKGGSNEGFIKPLIRAAEDAGVDLFTNQFVDDIFVAGGEVKGCRTKAGDEFRCNNAIVSTICVKDVFDYLGEDAPEEDSHYVKLLRHADFVALNQVFALDVEPEFKAGPGVKNTFCIEFAPNEKDYLRTFSDYKLGGFKPNLPLITIPSIADKSRAPEGHAVLNLYSYAPWDLRGDSKNWQDPEQAEACKEAVWEFFKSRCTNLTDANIQGTWSKTPYEYSQWNPAFRKGDIGHIGLQQSQMYDFRPIPGKGHEFHGDIENLYFVGTCGHPGGSVSYSARGGIAKILDDYGIDIRDVVTKN